MSNATKELLRKVRMIVPPMLEKFHKGMSRISINRDLPTLTDAVN